MSETAIWHIKANEHQKKVQKEIREAIISKVRLALVMQEGILKCYRITPQIRVAQSGKVAVYLTGHHKDVQEVRHIVHDLSRRLHIRFEKTISSSNFLKFAAVYQGVHIMVNTDQCFYGGKPKIIRRKRTQAICQNIKGKK